MDLPQRGELTVPDEPTIVFALGVGVARALDVERHEPGEKTGDLGVGEPKIVRLGEKSITQGLVDGEISGHVQVGQAIVRGGGWDVVASGLPAGEQRPAFFPKQTLGMDQGLDGLVLARILGQGGVAAQGHLDFRAGGVAAGGGPVLGQGPPPVVGGGVGNGLRASGEDGVLGAFFLNVAVSGIGHDYLLLLWMFGPPGPDAAQRRRPAIGASIPRDFRRAENGPFSAGKKPRMAS